LESAGKQTLFPGEIAMSTALTVWRPPSGAIALEDNDQWTNRFKVRSATSNRLYIIAQHKKKRHWGCSCPGWRRHRSCKHLTAIGLPGHEEPHDVRIENK